MPKPAVAVELISTERGDEDGDESIVKLTKWWNYVREYNVSYTLVKWLILTLVAG